MKKLVLHWAVLFVTLMAGASSVTKQISQVQRPAAAFKTLHTFGEGTDGAYPAASLLRDTAGNLYGTTLFGGANGDGTVFEVSYSKGSWKETVIYSFGGGADGIEPWCRLTFDKTGHIYGTTMNGGVNGWGTVFELSHTKTGWEEKVIYTFSWTDGANPIAGVILDKSGNLIGTTALGGSNGSGTVFELTLSGGRWTHTILHNFTGYPNDGTAPNSLLASDNLGNLYGTTEYGGSSDECGSNWGEGCGTAFELTPSSGGWSEMVLENFCVCQEGMLPQGLVLFQGSFYGTSSAGGAYGYGNAFKLTDQNGVWKEKVIYDFTGGGAGLNPQGDVIPDQYGHLYGTLLGGGGTQCGKLGCGTVFELKHSSAGWQEIVLHGFTGESDGGNPSAGLVQDVKGNLYGITYLRGGTVFEVTP